MVSGHFHWLENRPGPGNDTIVCVRGAVGGGERPQHEQLVFGGALPGYNACCTSVHCTCLAQITEQLGHEDFCKVRLEEHGQSCRAAGPRRCTWTGGAPRDPSPATGRCP
ncbi:unnamed protein product [Lepidochelys kempii]